MDNRDEYMSAEWRYLAILNYTIDPEILKSRLPAGTELALWNGNAYVSMVGVFFLNTRIRGVPVPLYQDFEKVNLRFYVRHTATGERGVVFIREMIPSWAAVQLAGAIQNNEYLALPMDHHFDLSKGTIEYAWRVGPRWHRLRASCAELKGLQPANWPPIAAGSEEEFFTAFERGFAAQNDGSCIEYAIEHPPWRVWHVTEAMLETNVRELYGIEFAPALRKAPESAFLIEGSQVVIYRRPIPAA